ncbi:MAG: hypothetical protein Tsb0027_21760 [Wenzhouxiangellaceae bacterium]
MNAILDDLKLALRSLWRTRLVTVLAVVTLALGIGATTAIFSVLVYPAGNTVTFSESESA